MPGGPWSCGTTTTSSPSMPWLSPSPSFGRPRRVRSTQPTSRSRSTPKVPDLWLLKSAAQVALGDQAGATASLAAALKDVTDQRSVGAHACAGIDVPELPLVRGVRPSLSSLRRRLGWPTRSSPERRLSRSTDPVSRVPPASGGVRIVGLRYAANRLTFTLQWRNLPPRTALSLLGYELPLVNRCVVAAARSRALRGDSRKRGAKDLGSAEARLQAGSGASRRLSERCPRADAHWPGRAPDLLNGLRCPAWLATGGRCQGCSDTLWEYDRKPDRHEQRSSASRSRG